MGIEPTRPAWEAGVLPLNYACASRIKPIADLSDTSILSVFILYVKTPACFHAQNLPFRGWISFLKIIKGGDSGQIGMKSVRRA